MAENDGQQGDELLLAALVKGLTQQQAAAAAGVSPRTVARRLMDPQFASQLREARAAIADACLGRLADAAGDAVEALRAVMINSKSDNTKTTAARAVLELFIKARQLQDVEARVAELESQLRGSQS
jgi:transcriptional regulator with XRE-family HTH domain